MNARLKEQYQSSIIPELREKYDYTNVMQVPKLEKVVINIGCGEMSREAKLGDSLQANLAQITGQKPVVTRSKKSISNFKLRAGMIVGLRVTLRRQHMYEFFDRLVSVAIPRIRDFRGASTRSFDGRGNYAMGLTEQLVFPEIAYDEVTRVQGMDVAFVTTARTDEEARELLRLLGMPFAN